MCKRKLLFLLALTFTATQIGAQTSSGTISANSKSKKASALHGRFWDGNINSPMAGAYIFVLSPDGKTILGTAKSIAGKGEDFGSWQITGLPADGEILLVGFDPNNKANMGVKKVTLNGQYQEVFGFEMKMPVQGASPSIHSDLPSSVGGDILNLAGTIAKEINSATDIQLREKLADYLLAEQAKSIALEIKSTSENLSRIKESIEKDTSRFRNRIIASRMHGQLAAWDRSDIGTFAQQKKLQDISLACFSSVQVNRSQLSAVSLSNEMNSAVMGYVKDAMSFIGEISNAKSTDDAVMAYNSRIDSLNAKQLNAWNAMRNNSAFSAAMKQQNITEPKPLEKIR